MRSSEWVADPLAAHCSISRVGPRIRSMCFCIRRFEMDSIPLRSLALGFVSGRSDICRTRIGARGLGIDADRFLVLAVFGKRSRQVYKKKDESPHVILNVIYL